MSKHENALRTALLRLNGQNPLPVSAFTPASAGHWNGSASRRAPCSFWPGAAAAVYRISNPAVFALHLRTLSPLAPLPASTCLSRGSTGTSPPFLGTVSRQRCTARCRFDRHALRAT